ncbi:MAG: diaminobutyrate acetyltransferase [Pigmentiphaga sp.]|nr:diaminobutyrate acetyltransferase [Pigmentiphaga sp.]
MTTTATHTEMVLRPPTIADGAAIHALIKACPPLDLNSAYAYLLLCHHFADTCVVAERSGTIVGYVSGYVPPAQPDVFFIWQVAVHERGRGLGLGQGMLRHLLERPAASRSRYVETTVSPSNGPSRAMFQRLAASLGTALQETALFTTDMFGPGAAHEDETLLRIGPFSLD